ncbi:Lipid carrier : UDP-N-acetylgalactosaminyltransferase (EC / Alpha-1,3-N-acetylgalactosamine transferase PglA (EC; Putative glycosyltransferase [Olavius algarvensis Delta 1 endosymbiont]|nr:Lipid carrier : UDP-N-acetylgalactosaminyltransferase (EC / Alpha-1,3-N-acetylgalactosamine transferase PglA (EC; Putative glycosyltransferase [Olavius algarvensis Delta 1 endosymbiont]
MLAEMVQRDHSVVACAPSASIEIKDALQAMGVEYRDVQIDRTGFNPIRDLQTVWRLFNLLRKIRPDIFLSYTVKPVIYGSMAAKIAGVSYIYSMITGLGYTFSREDLKVALVNVFVRVLYRLSLKTNRSVFFQNPDDRKLFTQLGLLKNQEQAVLINGTGVDVDFYQPAAFPEKLSFLLIARLLKDKGLREYSVAARIIKNKYPNISFRLVGWIDDNPTSISESELQSWIDQGLIEYLGKLSDIRPAVAEASVYVLPSYREGMPRTVLEAMSMGRPVITTDVPGCRETVSDGINGFLVPVRDVAALAQAMEHFVENFDLVKKMGQQSRKIAVEKYDVRKVNAVILETMGL